MTSLNPSLSRNADRTAESPRDVVLRPEIRDLLAQLKKRIRTYVLIEGLALLAVIAGSLFWLTFLADWTYFQATGLELPIWFREAVGIAGLALLAAGALVWIVLRIFARFRARALALVLERRFPSLGMRLITAVEIGESRTGRESKLTAAMIERAIDEAVRLCAALPLESVFDRVPLRRALAVGTFLLLSIAGLAVVHPAGMSRWARAFVTRDAVYWTRETDLVVRAVMQPGDRVREFRDGILKHPRGVDLVLLVEVPQGKRMPNSVELQYTLDAAHGSSRIEMIKTGDRQFRHTISGLLDSLALWVSGGDYVTRVPIRVEVVDPPRLDHFVLDCDYPSYTHVGQNADGTTSRRTIEVQSSQVTLPMETRFQLRAQSNKPLVALRLETEALQIHINHEGATIALRSPTGDTKSERALARTSEPFLSSDGLAAALPFIMTAQEKPEKSGIIPIPISANTRIRIELEDLDGVTSAEPIRLAINGVIDEPPVVQTELRGIGSSITRKAVIPIVGTIADDYGVSKARFEFRVGDAKDWRVRPLRQPPSGSPKEYHLRREPAEAVERFEVLPLELSIGQKLIVSILAEDGDNLNGPHRRRSEEYHFEIVSNEELLSLLYVKEVNLRERFEKLIGELEKVQKDLVDHRGRAAERKRLEAAGKLPASGEDLNELQTAIQICAVRSLHQVRKNSVETFSVEDSFRGLLEELVNNAVHTQQMVSRIGTLIVVPLHTANERDFPAADEAIGLFKLAADGREDSVPRIDESLRTVGTVIARLKAALNEMKDLVKFHEAISRLQGMIKEQEQITDSTKQEQKNKRLKELKGLVE